MRFFVRLTLSVLSAATILVPSVAAQTTINVPAQQPTIQAAINAASPGDSISVASGLYVENLTITKPLTIFGSAYPTTTTTIDGSALGPVVTISGVLTGRGVTLLGLTLQNGGKPQATGSPTGGVSVTGSYAVLSQLTLTKNFCQGVNATNSTVTLNNDTVQNTLATGCPSAEGTGSGIRISGNAAAAAAPFDAIHLGTNNIANNTASAAASDNGGGGGINLTGVSLPVIMEDNTVRYNTSKGYGGGIYIATTPTLLFADNLVTGNTGISGGIDLVVPGSSTGPTMGLIANNTIAGNSGLGTGGSIASDLYIGGNLAQYVLINNIIMGLPNGQAAVNCGTLYASQTLTPLVFDHNDIYSASGSTNTPVAGACTNPVGSFGNISANPQFTLATTASIAAQTSDFHLLASSPAIDTGNNDAGSLAVGTVSPPPTDIEGNQRYQAANGSTTRIVDMGAYEFAGTLTPATGTAIVLFPSTYTPTVGSTVTLQAILDATTTSPGGSIIFYQDGAAIGTVSSATSVASIISLPLTSGTHSFYATYSGQSGISPATSIPLYLLVGAAVTIPTNMSLTSTPNPSNLGQAVLFSVHLSSTTGVPTGTVYFYDGALSLGAGSVVDASGNATFTTSALATGNRSITAAFVATGTYAGETASLTQVVNGAVATAVLAIAPTTVAYGNPFTLTATVSGAAGTPTGAVNFLDGTAAIGSATLASGTASVTPLGSVGSHSYSCEYAGDSTYAPAACNVVPATVTIGPTTLTISSSASTSPALSPVTFTAKLLAGTTPVPNATITFGLTANPLSGVSYPFGTAVTNAQGIATYVFAGAYPGTYPFTNIYNGDATHGSSVSPTINVTFVQNPTTMSLTATPNPAFQNSPVTLGVSVIAPTGTAPPTGSATIYDSGTALGTTAQLAAPSGTGTTTTGTLTVSTLAPGTHNLTAIYTPFNPGVGLPAFLPSQTTAATPLVIQPSTFTLTASAPSLTVQTEHHASLGLTLTSIGGFTSPINLSCNAPLPPVVTCELASPVQLTANGTVNTTLTIDTDALLNYVQTTHPTQPNNPTANPRTWLALAALLPLTLLTTRRRKRALALSLLYSSIPLLLCLTSGCSGKYPDHTPPGTYNFALTAAGTTAGAVAATTKSVTVTLIVTP
jgi:hypothetical protein